MSRILASLATVSVLALAACNAPKTEEAPADEAVMTDPMTTEMPAEETTDAMPTEPMDPMAMPTDEMAMPDDGMGDDDPGNAGNDKGRPAR